MGIKAQHAIRELHPNVWRAAVRGWMMKKPFVALGIPSTYACHCVFGFRGRGLGEAYWGAMAKCLCVCHPSTRNLIFFLCKNGLDSRNGLAESVFTSSPHRTEFWLRRFLFHFLHLQNKFCHFSSRPRNKIFLLDDFLTDTRCSSNFFLPNDKRNENSSEMLFYVLCHNTQLTSVAVFIFPAISRIVGRMSQAFWGLEKATYKNMYNS